MEIKEFIENFANLFDDTNSSEIKANTMFKDLDEWSSLTALELISMVDEEYEIALGGDDIKSAVTVEDLFNFIVSKR